MWMVGVRPLVEKRLTEADQFINAWIVGLNLWLENYLDVLDMFVEKWSAGCCALPEMLKVQKCLAGCYPCVETLWAVVRLQQINHSHSPFSPGLLLVALLIANQPVPHFQTMPYMETV